MMSLSNTHGSTSWLHRMLSNREALNTALAGLLLIALAFGMFGKAHAEEVVDELGSYDREMLTSLIEAVIAADEGDMIVTAAIPDASAPASSPRSIIPTRRADIAGSAISATPAAVVSQADPGFALQLGSFASAENAQRGFEQASSKYGSTLAEHTLYVQPIDLGSRGVFHRLRIGGFENLPQASAACTSLGIAAADCMIVSAATQ